MRSTSGSVRTATFGRDSAILVAVGVDPAGKRTILGLSISLGEQEVHWRTFLQSLIARGLCGVRLVISDDHAGLKAARVAVLGGIPWQRCQFHLQQNAQAYVPRKELQAEVAADIRTVFNAPDRATAETYLARIVEKYQKSASRLSDWVEKNLPEGLTVFAFPASHQRKLRTSNCLERLNREIRRRTTVVSIFPHEGACSRLISAVLMEIDEEWPCGRTHLPDRDAVVVGVVEKWANRSLRRFVHFSTTTLCEIVNDRGLPDTIYRKNLALSWVF
jgi:putative transposase